MDSLLSENCKMGWKAESSHRIKNKEKTYKNYLMGWAHIVNPFWGEKPLSWLSLWWLAVDVDVLHFCSSEACSQECESYLSFGLRTWHPIQEWLHVEPRTLLWEHQRYKFCFCFCFTILSISALFLQLVSSWWQNGCCSSIYHICTHQRLKTASLSFVPLL